MAGTTVIPIRITGDERDIVAAWRRSSAEGRRAMRGVSREAAGFGGVMGGLRRQILGAGSALAGAFAARELVGEALAIEQATVKLRTQLGLTAAEAAAVERQSIDLSEAYGVAAAASIDAGFAIQSAGLRGAAASEALEAATKGAAIGLGAARDIGLLSAAAMTAWGEETLSATRSTEILGAAVKAGNLEASELTGSLGQALAPASTLGIAFEELAGSVAFYTRYGVGASESTTAVRQSINAMLKPSRQAKTVLDEINLSAADLQQMVGEQGLVATLQFLRRELGDDDEAFARVLGSTEALGFALAVTGEGAGDFAEIMDTMRGSVGSLDEAVDIQVETAGTKLAGAWQTVKGLGVDLAASVLPSVADGAKVLVGSLRGVAEAKADEAIDRVTAALKLFKQEQESGGGRAIAAMNEIWADLDRNLTGIEGTLGKVIDVASTFFFSLDVWTTTASEAEHSQQAFNAAVAAGVFVAQRAGVEVDHTTESRRAALQAVRALGYIEGDYADHIVARLIRLYEQEQHELRLSREEMSRRWAAIGLTRDVTIAMAQGNIFAATTTGDLAEAQIVARAMTDDLSGAAAQARQRIAELREEAAKELAADPFAELNASLGRISEGAATAQANLIATGAAVQIAEVLASGADPMALDVEAIFFAAESRIRGLRSSVVGSVQHWRDAILGAAGVGDGGWGGTPAPQRPPRIGGLPPTEEDDEDERPKPPRGDGAGARELTNIQARNRIENIAQAIASALGHIDDLRTVNPELAAEVKALYDEIDVNDDNALSELRGILSIGDQQLDAAREQAARDAEMLELERAQDAARRAAEAAAQKSWDQMQQDIREINERDAEARRQESLSALSVAQQALGTTRDASGTSPFERWLASADGQQVRAGLTPTAAAGASPQAGLNPNYVRLPDGSRVLIGSDEGLAFARANQGGLSPAQFSVLKRTLEQIAANTGGGRADGLLR